MENVANCTAEDTAKRFQTYLRKYENDEKLVVLKTVDETQTDETETGMKLASSFTSKVIRITITGTRGDGSPYIKNFIWKSMVPKSPASTFSDINLLYYIEGHVYSKVLPILGPYGPACIYQDEQNVIMEDLTEKGYVLRTGYLDLSHTVLTLKILAKFHASSLALKINDPQRFDEIVTPLKEMIYTKDNKTFMENLIPQALQWTINNIGYIKPQTQALQTMKNVIFNCKFDIYNNLKQLFSEPKQKYSTMCHTDVWINNLLYLYDDNDKPIDVKLIDYQNVRYTSAALDLLNYIYSSVSSSLIENSYESLIKIYHSTLLKELRQLHVSEVVLAELGEEWLEEGLKMYAFFALITGCWVLHMVLACDEEIKMYHKYGPRFDLRFAKSHKGKFERINCIVTHYYNRYHLGIIRDDLEPLPVTE
ncbi:uncharacterized protein LOC116840205 [Odontomachus brunneus]|uniref:uncharacterized protein LOC116840205 n=1 Tax=Odontomachus brunneus TaxID=486640 RepID=UPI0013F20245|nr:uncharacterized protein LOC116840205 [Odontomachus brunneus]